MCFSCSGPALWASVNGTHAGARLKVDFYIVNRVLPSLFMRVGICISGRRT